METKIENTPPTSKAPSKNGHTTEVTGGRGSVGLIIFE